MYGRTNAFPLALLVGLCCLLLAVPTAQAQQTVTINQARQTEGELLTIEGTVTRAFGDFARIQDESGDGASGITIRQTSGDFQGDVADRVIRPGTRLRITGSVSFFAGLAQINGSDLESYEILGQGDPPAPQTITLADLDDATSNDPGGEAYESELVRIEGLEFSESGTFSNGTTYEVTDAAGNTRFIWRVQNSGETNIGGVPIPGVPIDFEGVIGQFHGFDFNDEPDTGYQIIPVRVSDLNLPLVAFNAGFQVVEEGGTATLRVSGIGFQSGDESDVTVSLSGGSGDASDITGFTDPTTVTITGPDPAPAEIQVDIPSDMDAEGVEYLTFTLEADANALASDPATFTLWIKDDVLAQTTLFPGENGDALLADLQNAYGDPSTLGYDDTARDSLYGRIFNRDNTITSFYAGQELPLNPADGDPTSLASSLDLNTEHVYPQSKGSENEPAKSNLYILVPAKANVNSTRSNNPFAELDDSATQTWFAGGESQTTAPAPLDRNRWTEATGSAFEPRESVKGDVARAMFYFHALYRDEANAADPNFFPQQDSTLLQWHLADPVDADEVRRALTIASYQDNKINPFIFDPSLANRVYQLGDVAPTPPTATVTRVNRGEVRVDWKANPEADVSAYNVYRSTGSIDAPSDGQLLATVAASETSYIDGDSDASETYTYRVTAVDQGGNESALSNTTRNSAIPISVQATAEFAFGDRASSRSYRLVALPGAVEQGVGQSQTGSAGTDWNAYWDTGAEEDFFVAFDGSETFTFRPGRGFWLVSDAAWSVNASFDTVPLTDEGTFTVPIHSGWNIVSNPFDVPVSWNEVQALNPDLQSLWNWSAGFVQAPQFASASTGRAYYVYNDGSSTEMAIPYPNAVPEGARTSSNAPANAVQLLAAVGETPVSSIRVGVADGAHAGWDAHDELAPPARFQDVALRLPAPEGEAKRTRGAWLGSDVRSASTRGHAFDVTLEALPGETVTLTARNLDAVGDRSVILQEVRTGRTYDLRAVSEVRLRPAASSTQLRLLVGSKQFVDGAAESVTPSAVQLLPNYPNPFTERTTVQYTLPEAATVELAVYDLLGRRVTVLDQGRRTPGVHRVTWDAPNLSSGMYLIRLEAGATRLTTKAVRIQ